MTRFAKGDKLRAIESRPNLDISENTVYECLATSVNRKLEFIVCIRNDRGIVVWAKGTRFVGGAGSDVNILGKPECTCDLYTVLLRTGCKCGGK